MKKTIKIILGISFGLVLITQEMFILSKHFNKTDSSSKTVVKTVQAVKIIKEDCEHEIYQTKDKKLELNETDMQILYRVASAEAGIKSSKSIKNVVTVILNRINNPSFEFDVDVETTVFRFRQFSCVEDGGYAKARVNDVVRNAVKEAVLTYEYDNNIVRGATHYANLDLCNPKWQATLKKVDVEDPVGHTFFK